MKYLGTLFFLIFTMTSGVVAEDKFDYLITGGLVFDGSGSEGKRLVVGVVGDEITYVGSPKAGILATNHINASGLIVAPGFIDPHTHAYQERPAEGADHLQSYVTQGVTTVFSGNDGGGPIDTGSALGQISKQGIAANFGLFVGHGALRRHVMGMDDRPPTADELSQMKQLVADAMKAGALGLSSGLFYAPGSFAATDEVIELAKVAGEYGGVYESHIRDESNYSIGVIGAVAEAIEIGQEAEIPVHIAHIKALGVDVWGQSSAIIELIEEARTSGQIVTADQYPWLASGTRVSNALVPRRAMAGGTEAMKGRLMDAAQLPQLKTEMAENMRRRGGASSILLTGGKSKWRGLTLGDYAEKIGQTPIDTAVAIVLDGDAGIASFNMNPQDVRNFMVRPWVMTSSDGVDGHPRKYASFPRKYRRYVVEEGTLAVAEYIRRSSGLTATTFGLKDRGFLREGMKADIVIFDPLTFGPKATYENATQLSEGVWFLLVNGIPVIWQENRLSATPGQALRQQHRHDRCRIPYPGLMFPKVPAG